MKVFMRLGEKSQKWKNVKLPSDLCEVCGSELDIDTESGERHCPVCENPEM